MSSFINYVKAGYPLLVVKSYEEFKVIHQYIKGLNATTIKNAANVAVPKFKTFAWDFVDGARAVSVQANGSLQTGTEAEVIKFKVTDAEGSESEEEESTKGDPGAPLKFLEMAPNNTILFVKDYHPYLKPEFEDSTTLIRKIRNLANKFKAQCKCLVFVSPAFKVPMELEKEVAIIDYDLPTKADLEIVLKHLCQVAGVRNVPAGNDLEAVLDAAAGMTHGEAENAFCVSLTEKKKIDAAIVRREKAQVVKKNGLLEIIDAEETMSDIGGLELLKAWINMRSNCFTPEARAFGVKPAKGILLLGVPGCGKSLTAKAIASGLRRVLVRLDMGKIFGSYVGESEENMARCLRMLESIAPCILWIDEIEKGLSGNKSGQEGHETTRRVFQMLLTWLQEKKKDVFLVATANSIDNLPPELLRAGRIDATFWVGLPDAVQREEILKIHLKKAGRDPEMFNDKMPALMALCRNFTGAEIEVWVNEAVTRAFSLGHSNIQFDDLEEAIKEVTPIYKLQGDEIRKSARSARARGTKPASVEHESVSVEEQLMAAEAPRQIDIGDAA